MSRRACAPLTYRCRSTRSTFKVLKNLSATALSQQLALRLIDWTIRKSLISLR